MHKFLLLCIVFFSCASVQDLNQPVLDEKAVISIVNQYLDKNSDVVIEKYELKNINFDASNMSNYNNQWHLLYVMKINDHGTRRSVWFTLSLTNDEEPDIKLTWGY